MTVDDDDDDAVRHEHRKGLGYHAQAGREAWETSWETARQTVRILISPGLGNHTSSKI